MERETEMEIVYNDKTIYLNQDPYFDDDCGPNGDGYYATGFDDAGVEYEIFWKIIPGREGWEDESECCDWDRFKIIGCDEGQI